jgi:hypothetical protein
MRFRTLAVALALSFGLTAIASTAEGKQNPAAHRVKAQKPKKYKPGKVKRGKVKRPKQNRRSA